jgi:hypothetical protein
LRVEPLEPLEPLESNVNAECRTSNVERTKIERLGMILPGAKDDLPEHHEGRSQEGKEM